MKRMNNTIISLLYSTSYWLGKNSRSANLWIKLVPRLFFFCLTPFIAPFDLSSWPLVFSRCLGGLGWQISFALRGNKLSHGKSNTLSFRFWHSTVYRDFLHHSVHGSRHGSNISTFIPSCTCTGFMLEGLRSFFSLKLTLLGWCCKNLSSSEKPFRWDLSALFFFFFLPRATSTIFVWLVRRNTSCIEK